MSEAETDQNMPNKCPQCGATLPAGALEGLCPACLLRQGAETAAPPHEALPFQPPTVEEVARLFPQLEILAFIGKGGMGAVYKARQRSLDRLIALKILPPQAAGGPGFAERFNREARALARLNHPNIVSVFEFGQVNELPFFIMEFVDGLNLRQLEQAGKLTPREALQIVPQICEALQFAHDEGIVHRDIKPENILVDKKGRVKIADFGIAKILGQDRDVSITETKGALGTPHYMAPEQMENPTSVDHRADIFSLGVVFYEMLTGELPLGKFSPPSSRRVEVDVRLDDVVLRALEKDPELRYQHVSQVKTAVDTIATSAAPPAANGHSLAQEILARGYELNIRSCFRRAWALVRSDFWPIIGTTALVLALFSFASSAGGAFTGGPGNHEFVTGSSVLGMLVYGPLMGGLSLFYLKKIRREPTTIETAFSGFSHKFLHLFLGGFVTWLLTGLGFVCLILPGIYLLVAWWFTLTLVADKNVDFWSAMELSRKVVTRHWWKFLGFFLVVLLVFALGFVALIIGLLITVPIGMLAATFAYEDIFGTAAATPFVATGGLGPTGTIAMSAVPPKQPGGSPTTPPSGGAPWKPQNPGYAVAAVALSVVVVILFFAIKRHRNIAQAERQIAAQPIEARQNSEFDDLAERVREELNRASIRFGDLHLSSSGDNSMIVSFSGLEELAMIDGTNAWQSITGALDAARRDGDRWEFRGQDKLQTVHFDMFEPHPAELLEQSRDHKDAATTELIQNSKETLKERFDAASEIRDPDAKNEAMSALARDAAKAGEPDIVKTSVDQITDPTMKNETAYESVQELVKVGKRKQAFEIAKSIGDPNLRDKALSELAQ